MRAALKNWRLVFISTLVVVVPKLMINRAEFVIGLLDAHLDTKIVTAVEAPGARMTNDVAILWRYKL